jgi:hypothetical protein
MFPGEGRGQFERASSFQRKLEISLLWEVARKAERFQLALE